MRVTRRVIFLPAANDGCALWRMYMPYLRYPGSNYVACDIGKPLPINTVVGYHVGVVQRLSTDMNYNAIRAIKQKGLKVVYDLDDNIWSLPRYNPAYRIFRDPKMLRGAEKCIREAHKITTSTEWLAGVVKRRLGNEIPVETIENAIDLHLFTPARLKIRRPYTIIGWAGTPTHHIDLVYAMNALAEVMRERTDVRAEFMGGTEVPEQIAELVRKGKVAKDRVGLHPWIQPREYPVWVSNLKWDIALAPLAVENEFNKSKSNIKMLEAAAIGIPCLASPTLEYSRFCGDVPLLKDLLCSRTEDWIKRMHEFIDSPELRQSTADAMRTQVLARYNLWDRLEQINRVYETV